MTKFVLACLLILVNISPSWADQTTIPKNEKQTIYQYGYVEREHSFEENIKNIALVYGLTWVVYPTFQPKVLKIENGFKKYKHNFGKIVFDKDEPIWNNLIHPITGSQLYLLYRADGYTKMEAMAMSAISSTLFEFTVEILSEPASIQDLYQTPVLGTILGLGIEHFSMFLLNSDSSISRFFGHVINPATILPLYQGRTLIIPQIKDEDKGAMIRMDLAF